MKDAEQPKFIHLRCHSEYSVTDGIVKIEEYLNQALEVDREILEAADSFGATPSQKLRQVQFPLALPTIFAGVNQTIMMALAMVIIASMIGVKGLGQEVLRAIFHCISSFRKASTDLNWVSLEGYLRHYLFSKII